MTSPRRTDQNQRDIVAAYRRLGVAVADTHVVGLGFPDLVVAIEGGPMDMVEVKTAEGKFTPAEREFIARWPVAVVVVRSVEDVVAHVREMREEALRCCI